MIPESPSAIRAVLAERGLAAQKRFGQSFLADRNLRDAIVTQAGVGADDTVLEVGPGLGMLTKGLLGTGARVVAVELDRGFAAFLREAFAGEERFTLIEGDVLDKRRIRSDAFAALPEDFTVVANLPYSAATPFLSALARLDRPPAESTVMVQLEVARRLVSGPGSRDYGPLAVLLGLRGEAAIVREIGGRVFVPPVKVRSALVYLRLETAGRERAITGERLAREVFLYRRKAIRRALLFAGHPAERVDAALEAAGVDPGHRPETLSVDAFVTMGELLGEGRG
jgi:16S rRNA (adenine1518-N6/adenine1519-N6)-dimethyltransferase